MSFPSPKRAQLAGRVETERDCVLSVWRVTGLNNKPLRHNPVDCGLITAPDRLKRIGSLLHPQGGPENIGRTRHPDSSLLGLAASPSRTCVCRSVESIRAAHPLLGRRRLRQADISGPSA